MVHIDTYGHYIEKNAANATLYPCLKNLSYKIYINQPAEYLIKFAPTGNTKTNL